MFNVRNIDINSLENIIYFLNVYKRFLHKIWLGFWLDAVLRDEKDKHISLIERIFL